MSFPHDPFRIGGIEIQPALVLAPLHEITDVYFRRMIREIGGVGLTVSEMVSSEALTRDAHKAFAQLTPDGHPYAVQLSGSNPERLAEGARIAVEAGADFVDLNMGCPASNVTRSGSGSALLRDFSKAEACVLAMVKAVTVPVTVKMRTGWDMEQQQRGEFMDFLAMFRDAGVQAVTVHPRTRAQQYTGHSNWSLITQAVDAGMPYPIVGNGDVTTPEDAYAMTRETGCAAVMIGRAAMTNPFLFKQITEPHLVVSPQMRVDLTLCFLRSLLVALEPREALHRIKKIGGWFTKGIPGGAPFRHKLNEKHDPVELLAELEALQLPLSAGDPGKVGPIDQ